MAKASSRLPLLLGGLAVLVVAAAAILLLLPQEAPPSAPVVPSTLSPVAEEDLTLPEIAPFEAPDEEARSTQPPPPRQLGSLAGQLLTIHRRPVTSGRIELLEGIPLGLGGLSHLPRLGPRGQLTSDGRFLIENVPASDQVVVRALGDSFETTESGPFLVNPGETCDIGVIIVDPGLTVHGVITDGRGRGIAGARVALSRGPPMDIGRDPSDPERVVLTDESGSYSMAHATQGAFSLAVSAMGFGNVTRNRAVQLEQPGQIEINVHLAPALLLEGVVLLPGGSDPAMHVEVLAQGREPGLGDALVRTDSQGRFRFTDLTKGRYLLRLDPEGYLPATEEVFPGTFDEDITIHLLPASGLAGTVTDTAGKALRAFDLQLRHSDKSGTIGSTVGASQRVRDKDGRFEIGDLVPGWYLVEVWSRGHSVTLSEPAMVRKSGKVTQVTVAMQQSSTLLGQVLDDLGEPIGGASISLHSNNTPTSGFLRASAARGSWHSSTHTDSEGKFKFTEVTARTYQIAIDHPRYPVVHRNDVTVLSGQETEIAAVVLDRPAVLKGVVTDASGQILKGISVTLGGGSNRATRQVVSDAEGRYRFERLAPGTYQVHAYAPTASPMGVLLSSLRRIKIDAEGQPIIPVDLTLEPGEEREYRVIAQS